MLSTMDGFEKDDLTERVLQAFPEKVKILLGMPTILPVRSLARYLHRAKTKKQGVYCIFAVDGKLRLEARYIGSSKTIRIRITGHIWRIARKSTSLYAYQILAKPGWKISSRALVQDDCVPPEIRFMCETICMLLLGSFYSDFDNHRLFPPGTKEVLRQLQVRGILDHPDEETIPLNKSLPVFTYPCFGWFLTRTEPATCEACGQRPPVKRSLRFGQHLCLTCINQKRYDALDDALKTGPCAWCLVAPLPADGDYLPCIINGQAYCGACKRSYVTRGGFRPRRKEKYQEKCACSNCPFRLTPETARLVKGKRYCPRCGPFFKGREDGAEHRHGLGKCECPGCPMHVTWKLPLDKRLVWHGESQRYICQECYDLTSSGIAAQEHAHKRPSCQCPDGCDNPKSQAVKYSSKLGVYLCMKCWAYWYLPTKHPDTDTHVH